MDFESIRCSAEGVFEDKSLIENRAQARYSDLQTVVDRTILAFNLECDRRAQSGSPVRADIKAAFLRQGRKVV